MNYITNVEIERIINKPYRPTLEQQILYDRLINGSTYDAIIDKYYPMCFTEQNRKDTRNLLETMFHKFIGGELHV